MGPELPGWSLHFFQAQVEPTEFAVQTLEVVGVLSVEAQGIVEPATGLTQTDDIGLQSRGDRNEIAGELVIELRERTDDTCIWADALNARIAAVMPKSRPKSNSWRVRSNILRNFPLGA